MATVLSGGESSVLKYLSDVDNKLRIAQVEDSRNDDDYHYLPGQLLAALSSALEGSGINAESSVYDLQGAREAFIKGQQEVREEYRGESYPENTYNMLVGQLDGVIRGMQQQSQER